LAAFAFGGIHGQVGVPEELIDGACRSGGRDREADARSNRDGNAVDHDRGAERLENIVCRRLGFFDGTLEQYREFVTPDAGDEAVFV